MPFAEWDQGARVMNWRRLRRLALCGIVLPVWVAAGCTNSDALHSGVNRLAVRVEVTNTTTRFAQAGFLVNQLTVRPVDPTASAVLGSDPIGLLASTAGGIDIDLNGSETMFEATSPLPVGAYQLQSVVLQELLFKSGTPDPNATSCAGAVVDYDTASASIDVAQFDDVIANVTIGSEGNELRLIIDGAALATAFEASWGCGCRIAGTQCIQGISCGAAQRCVVPPFSSGVFTARAPTFLQFP